MTACVIVMGFERQTRLPSDVGALQGGDLAICYCNTCSHAFRVVFPQTADGAHTVAYLDSAEIKPAETYAFQFVDGARAKAWLEAHAGDLAGKTVFLIDPAVDEPS